MHGGDKVSEIKQCSEQILDELEKEYPAMLSELMYPIWEHQQPFQIPLIETRKQPTHHCLYPSSSEELAALKNQINEWLVSGYIVPSASLYGHPVLFVEQKGGGGLCLYVDSHFLNANTVTDAQPLPRIDNLLSQIKGAKVFSGLDLCDSYHQIPIDPDN